MNVGCHLPVEYRYYLSNSSMEGKWLVVTSGSSVRNIVLYLPGLFRS
jgi:hypothetical protein